MFIHVQNNRNKDIYLKSIGKIDRKSIGKKQDLTTKAILKKKNKIGGLHYLISRLTIKLQ